MGTFSNQRKYGHFGEVELCQSAEFCVPKHLQKHFFTKEAWWKWRKRSSNCRV